MNPAPGVCAQRALKDLFSSSVRAGAGLGTWATLRYMCADYVPGFD